MPCKIELEPAATPAEAFWALATFALVHPGHPWFCDVERSLDGEDYGVARRLRRCSGAAPGRPAFVHVALVGHPGTGKTTLARQVLHRLAAEGLHPVFLDAPQSLDPSNFTFTDLVLLAAEAVVREAVAQQLPLSTADLSAMRRWCLDELLGEPLRQQVVGELDENGDSGTTLHLVAKLAEKVTAALKSDHERRREIRLRGERNPGDLVRGANALFDAVHRALGRGKKLCVVFDGLEKMPVELVDKALLQRASEPSEAHVRSARSELLALQWTTTRLAAGLCLRLLGADRRLGRRAPGGQNLGLHMHAAPCPTRGLGEGHERSVRRSRHCDLGVRARENLEPMATRHMPDDRGHPERRAEK